MCKLSDNCEIFFYIIICTAFIGRFIISFMILLDTLFRETVIIISILSSLSVITIIISIILNGISYTYSSYFTISTKDYIYTRVIDISKEDYREGRIRLDNQEYYFNWFIRTYFISFIFTLGIIEEIFRIDIFNLYYYVIDNFTDNYNSDLYIISIIEAIAEFIFVLIYICMFKIFKKE